MSRKVRKKKRIEVVTAGIIKTSEPVETVEPVIVEAPKETWQDLVKQLPEATSAPTQRWYGETFYPQYSTVYVKLKALVDG